MQPAITHALKEWAVAVAALEQGRTIALLRKGGIHERGGRFAVAHNRVLLYPTYEHQQPFLLKPDYAVQVTPVSSGWHPKTVRIGSWAEITDILPVSDESTVHALLPFHVWNEQFIGDRLKWKPSQPLYVLLLRTYICQAHILPYRQEYGGCKSWIDLAESIPTTASKPVLDDVEYSQLVAKIQRLVGNQLSTNTV